MTINVYREYDYIQTVGLFYCNDIDIASVIVDRLQCECIVIMYIINRVTDYRRLHVMGDQTSLYVSINAEIVLQRN